MERFHGETYLSYAKRLTIAVEDGLLGYKEYGDLLLGDENTYSSENLRKAFYVISKMLKRVDCSIDYTEEELKKELEQLKFEIIKERKKIQTVNLEYNASARYEARAELFNEMAVDGIRRMAEKHPIVPKHFPHKRPEATTGVLYITDAHYGKEFCLKGLFGETVNEYSPKIFQDRMWNLLSKMETERFEWDKLKVMDLGDCIEGILRMGSLQKLKVGVIDSVLEYAEFMAKWLNEAANVLEMPVEYALTGGNHDMVRLLTEKKVFDDENVGKLIHKYINLRVENLRLENGFSNVMVLPYSDIIYQNIYGMNILAYHGDTKNLKEDIEFFENYYQIDVDILVCGHLHRNSQETIGMGYMGDREIVRVPSIIGVDNYSKKIRKLSRAGAKFMLFSDSGKELEKTYFLS